MLVSQSHEFRTLHSAFYFPHFTDTRIIWTFHSPALLFLAAESPQEELSFSWNFRSVKHSKERIFQELNDMHYENGLHKMNRVTFTEFTEGHQYRHTDGLVGTGSKISMFTSWISVNNVL